MKVKLLYAFAAIVMLTLDALFFIWKSNDHLECEETIVQTTDAAGNPVVEKQHICREQFSI